MITVNIENRIITIKRTRRRGKESDPKSDYSIRDIPIFVELLPFIENQYLLTGAYKSYVFLNSKKEPFYDLKKYLSYWKKLLNNLKIHPRRLHDLRHSFAIMTIESGKFNVNQIAYFLGHSDVAILFRYYNSYIQSEIMKVNKDYRFLGD